MSTLETEPARAAVEVPAGSASTSRGINRKATAGGRRAGRLVLWLAVLALVGVGAFLLTGRKPPFDVAHVVEYFQSQIAGRGKPQVAVPLEPTSTRPVGKWNGLVSVTPEQAKAIGLQVVEVRPQTETIKLELTGRTAYNPNSLNKIRPRFDTLVEKVHAESGQHVRKGDPLVDLFSTELATAKNDFQTKYVQWQHDLRLLRLREKLVVTGAISQQVYVDTQNEENKSRLEYATSRDEFRVLGVPESEIDPLIRNLGDLPAGDAILASVSDKAKMTLRSPIDGIVIQREVVPGNLYDETSVLMVIAPLDSLWIFANVYEVDQSKVAVGQRMEIHFPFLRQTTHGTVEYVSSEVSRDTRAVQIRASIPNLDGKLKADMLVKTILEIPPIAQQTHIPRLAMVVINGQEYVFVRKPDEAGQGPDRFERRPVHVAQENAEFVVLDDGVTPAEGVATSGSLILAQLYEDLQTVETGMPVR